MTEQQVQPQQRQLGAGGIFLAVLGAILVAVILVAGVVSLAGQDDALSCATENAERVLDGLPEQSC